MQMQKILAGAFLLLGMVGLAGLAGCRNEPPPTAVAPHYTIVSERAAGGGVLTVSAKMAGAPSEALAKMIAEDVISKRRAQYGNITVTTYSDGDGSSGKPYSTSTFDGRTISHKFSGQPEEQRIATH
jgi:hypothetical protein